MKTTQFYPVLMVSDVESVSQFYLTHFGFQSLFAADWYVHLQSLQDDSVNLAILDRNHETIPDANRGAHAQGLLLNFEVADVDAVYQRFCDQQLPILLPLRSEDFGQRHFITQDPEGVMIDVVTPIAPSEDFAANYASDALPG